MLQNQHQLEQKMNRMLPEIREAFLKNLLEKGLRSRDEYERLKLYDIPLDKQSYQCICVEIDDYSTMLDLYNENDMYYFEYGVLCVIREALSEKGLSAAFFNAGYGRFSGVAGYRDHGDVAVLYEGLHTIRKFIEDYYPFTVTIGVSRVRKGAEHANLSYNEAVESLRRKMVLGTGQVISYVGLTGSETDFVTTMREVENGLVQAVREADREKAYAVLDRLMELKGEEKVDYRRIQHHLIELSLFLWRELAGEERFPHSIEQMMRLSTLEQWIGWLREHCIDRLIGNLSRNRHKQYMKISAMLTQYMINHCEEDLRLGDVCREMGIPVYIAKKALKEIHQTTFSEYFFHIRIEQSKKWLEQSNMTIEEISFRLYYSNAQNFSRAFKKAVGVSPGQYRKLRCAK